MHANIGDLLDYQDPWRRADIGAGVTAAFVSLRLGFSPGQLLDLLAGLAGFDPSEDDRGLADAPASPTDATWLRGDLHAHCSPPDSPRHAPITAEETVDLARANGLAFIGITPHQWAAGRTRTFNEDEYDEQVKPLLASTDPVVLLGREYTDFFGHALLLERGGEKKPLLIPTHPATRDLLIPFIPDHARPWMSGDAYHGLEALTFLHALGELGVGRSGEDLATDEVFRILDQRILAEKRRYTVTGGCDNHRDVIPGTMHVLAKERSRGAILEAIEQGRVVIGLTDEAASLEARTDLDAAWRPIGADLRAQAWVELRWRGTGTLVADGVARDADDEPFRHATAPGSFHAYRLEAGPGRRSRSAWIYVNRPGAQ